MNNLEMKNLAYQLLQDVADSNLNKTTKMAFNTLVVDYLKLNDLSTPKKLGKSESGLPICPSQFTLAAIRS